MRGGRRRTETSGALVGWLFADITLVLMIVFASTTVTASSTTPEVSPTTSSTTTTVPKVTTTVGIEQGGVKLEALEPDAVEIGEPTGLGVAARLERVLEKLKSSGVIAAVPQQVGVILIYAGAKTDGDIAEAKKRACLVRDALLREWSRIESGRVYFKCFHALNLENDFVEFSLFPVLD